MDTREEEESRRGRESTRGGAALTTLGMWKAITIGPRAQDLGADAKSTHHVKHR